MKEKPVTESIASPENEALYKQIRQEMYMTVQIEVMKKFSIELEEWGEGVSSPAVKYSFIFHKLINEAIEQGVITSLDDAVEKEGELIDEIYEYMRTHDISRRFSEKYQALKGEKEEALSPMNHENYRTPEGYMWVYNLVQAEIMWLTYKDKGGPDVMENIEDWENSSSLEYNEAMQVMMLIYKDDLLERFHENFYNVITHLERIMNNIRELEATVESDLHIERSRPTREHILSALDNVIVKDPIYISRTQNPEKKKELVHLVEEELESVKEK